MLCKIMKMCWILWLASLTTCLLGSSTLAGQIENCQRLHTFIVSGDSNRTSLTYRNTGLLKPTVTTFDGTLPSPSLCGADYERCNVLDTSNSDRLIRVVLLPLESGIGMVSFDYSIDNDSLVFREKFLLPQNEPNCTYVYFVKQVIGYCLEVDPPRIRAFRIYIDFSNLGSSSIQQDTFATSALDDISGLSNIILFAQGKLDDCFTNEGNHVLFLNGGYIYDHSFSDEQIYKYVHGQIDATCSRLHRIGTMCDLAVHCNNSALVFDTREQEQFTSVFMEAEYGQTFFCPSNDFVSFRNETLTLHHQNREQFGNTVLFPFEEIHLGYCLEVIDNFLLVATIDEGRAVLVNFQDALYQEIGVSDPSTVVLANVEGRIAFVNNGSETYLYNFGLACTPKSIVLPKNFVLATSAVFSTRVLDQCRCLDPVITTKILPIALSFPTLSPTLSSSPAVLVSGSLSTSTALEHRSTLAASVSSTLTPSNEPVSSPMNSPNTDGIIGGAVAAAAGLLIAIAISLSLIIIVLLRVRKSSKRQDADHSELLTLGQASINDNLMNKRQDVDQSLAENYEPQKLEVRSKGSPGDDPQVLLVHVESYLQQSTDSLRTEVQVKDIEQEDHGTDSGSADTSTTVHDPQPNLRVTLDYGKVVCEEVGEEAVTVQSNSVSENDSQPIMFNAEIHQDANEEVSNVSETVIMNPVPVFSAQLSPTHLDLHVREPGDVEGGVYAQPLADTSGESSQLLVANLLGSRSQNHRPPPTVEIMEDNELHVCFECSPPMQITPSSGQPRLVVSNFPGASCSSIHRDDLQDRYQQIDNMTNSEQDRQRATEIGARVDLWNEGPDNNRHLMDNAATMMQMSTDGEQLTGDPDVLRQISTDSEESRG